VPDPGLGDEPRSTNGLLVRTGADHAAGPEPHDELLREERRPVGRYPARRFERVSSRWVQRQILTAFDGETGFGRHVTISGNTIVVSSRVHVSGRSGGAYVFDRAGSLWSPGPKLVPTGGGDGRPVDDGTSRSPATGRSRDGASSPRPSTSAEPRPSRSPTRGTCGSAAPRAAPFPSRLRLVAVRGLWAAVQGGSRSIWAGVDARR
jgi:hypothetical protein